MTTETQLMRVAENQNEFKEAARLSLQLRHALARYGNRFNATKLNNRLIKKFMKIIQADAINPRGERKLQFDNIAQLKDFALSETGSPQLSIYQNYKVSIVGTDEKNARLEFLGELIPALQFKPVTGATHIELTLVLLSTTLTDDDTVQVSQAAIKYNLRDYTNQSAPVETPSITVEPDRISMALLFVGYTQEVNGIHYPLQNKNYNPSVIAALSTT